MTRTNRRPARRLHLWLLLIPALLIALAAVSATVYVMMSATEELEPSSSKPPATAPPAESSQ